MKIKIGDIVVIGVLIVFIVVLSLKYFGRYNSNRYVRISGWKEQLTFPINENRKISVNGPLGVTDVVIRDGEVWIKDSPCKNKICIKMGKIKRPGEQVICVPNRVVVEIIGKGGNIDAVSR